MFLIGVCECCSNGEESVGNAMVGSRRRARRSFVLLAMLWPPSPDDCIEDCASGSSAEGDTTRVGRCWNNSHSFVLLLKAGR